ncbi:MAG: hypothetical protein JNK85_07765 [Verrucomicrobiales bacterium]|nr:hypothetical protein [Verrucomicrobiales bacterium]
MADESFSYRTLVVLLLWAVETYAALGVIFAMAFQWRGLRLWDPVAAASSWGFRVIITPGVILLWPMLAWRWRQRVVSPQLPPAEKGRDALEAGPRRLRSAHAWAWKALVVLAPLVLAGAIAYRPKPATARDWPRSHFESPRP